MSSKDSWESLKKRVVTHGLYGANQANTDVTLRFLEDLELGVNIGGEKGGRSPSRLITIVRRMSTLSYLVEHRIGAHKRLVDVTERELLQLIKELREGTLQGKRGVIRDVSSVAKTAKQFYAWYVRAERKAGRNVDNVALDLPTSNDYKPAWVYLTEKQISKLAIMCRFDYQALIWFVIDSGVRPQELAKIRVSDVNKDEEGTTWLNIRHEVAKKNSFGRRIKLLVCHQLLWQYIEQTHFDEKGRLLSQNILFPQHKETVKKYLRRRAKKLWGEQVSLARNEYKNISLYDLRHNSAVYWQNRYHSINSLMYRFGWKDPKRLHYYSEALGHTDSIQEEHLLVDKTATQLEKELAAEKQRRILIEEQLVEVQRQLEIIGLWQEWRTRMPQDSTKDLYAPSVHEKVLSKIGALSRSPATMGQKNTTKEFKHHEN